MPTARADAARASADEFRKYRVEFDAIKDRIKSVDDRAGGVNQKQGRFVVHRQCFDCRRDDRGIRVGIHLGVYETDLSANLLL